jgi:hypothetical protein
MSRIKLVLLSMVVVLGVSAVASSSAFAIAETRYFVGGTEVSVQHNIEGNVETAQLNTQIASLKTILVCTENTFTGNIKSGGTSEGTIKFKKCKLYEIKAGVMTLLGNCMIGEPIEFTFKDQLFDGPAGQLGGGIVEDEFRPAGGGENEVFVKIKITGSLCVPKGELEPKGTYVASMGDEAERELEKHELVFTSTGGKIKLGPEKGAFTNRVGNLKLEGGGNWRG